VTGLLDGMRVLDAGIWRPVPHATQMLADLGAHVLKIEPPGGDPMRTFPQLFRDIAGHKASIELNLRSAEGRARALELVSDADVFCEGWRPGVAARLGLGYDDVRARNPSIIYCSVSGYGVFACADDGWITLAVISEDHFWQAVCDGLALADELRSLGHLARLDRFDECQAAVAAACARLTRDEALERLTRAGAPVAPVLDPAEMAANEQFRVREVVFDAGDGTARLGFPARLQDHPPRPPGPIPEVDRDRSGWTSA
jgi:crotonobetainyl-CoA:carnitine CoA-transferase CaiB-like acyl-CoA transferase